MSGVPSFLSESDRLTDPELLALVFKDDLTGLYNRRFFARFMKQEADWGPGAQPVALAMIDLDNLKKINDRLGHLAGDAVIKRIGGIFNEHARGEQFAIRYAGDEFALILPGVGRAEAIALADRVRQAVVDDPFGEAGLPEGLRPSLSVGVALFPDDAPAGGDDLTEAADRALYVSKRTGKNKVTSVHELDAGKAGAQPTVADALPAPALAGGDALVAAVEAACAAAAVSATSGRAAPCAVFALAGERGRGKTRWTAELAARAAKRGLLPLVEGAGEVSRDAPLRLVAGLVSALLERRPELVPAVGGALAPAARSALRSLVPGLGASDRLPRPGGPVRPPATRTPPRQPRPGGPGGPGAGGPGPHGPGGPGSGSRPRPQPPGPGQPGRVGPPSERMTRPEGAPPRPAPGAPGQAGAAGPGSGMARRPGPPGQRPGGPRPPGPAGRPPGGPGPADPARAAAARPEPRPRPSDALVFADTADDVVAPGGAVAPAQALADALVAAARKVPLFVALDDAHLADEGTLEVFARVAGREAPLVVVLTGAAGEEAGWSLPAAVGVERRALPALDAAATAALLASALGPAATDQAQAARLAALTGGSPLALEGALKRLGDMGALARRGDAWRLAGAIPDDVTPSLEELVRGRLRVVPSALVAALEGAVVGPRFAFEVLDPSRPPAAEATREAAAGPRADAEGDDAGGRPGDDAGDHEAPADPLASRPDHAKRQAFTEALAGCRERVLDRAALEAIGDGRRVRLPERSDPPSPELAAALPALAEALSRAVARARAGGDATDDLLPALAQAHAASPAFTLAHRGNALTLNGRTVDRTLGEGPAQEAVSGLFRQGAIKSLTFVGPVREAELRALVRALADLGELAALERNHWNLFATDHELRTIGVVQKSVSLSGGADVLDERAASAPRLAEADPALAAALVQALLDAVELQRRDPPCEPSEAVAALVEALGRAFAAHPAVVLHEGDGDALVLNGVTLEPRAGAPAGKELLAVLRGARLMAVALLPGVTQGELEALTTAVAHLTPEELAGEEDPILALAADPGLPHVLVGHSVYRAARAAFAATDAAEPSGAAGGAVAEPLDHEILAAAAAAEEGADMSPLRFREAELPAEFEWPSDAAAQRAHALTQLPPHDLLAPPASEELADVLERLLLEERFPLAFRLFERLAVGFAAPDAAERRRAADAAHGLLRRGSQDLRAAFLAVAARRLGDALEAEQDPDAFERLADCGKLALTSRIAAGDWELAARFAWALARRRGDKRAAGDAQARSTKTARRVLGEVLEDPRAERLFQAIERGGAAERRKAARVLEAMGTLAVDRLVRALAATTSDRVEAFLIDMLAALVPESEQALQREATTFTAPEPMKRLMRAAAVVCRDAAPVLVAGLQSPDPLIQAEAVTVARGVGGKVAQAVLRWALQHGQPATQLTAVKYLGELAHPDAVDELLDLVQRTNIVEVQRECCLTFGKLSLSRAHHDKVIPMLANFLRPGGLLRSEYHEDVRAAAAWSLGQMRSVEAARKTLERALDDKDKRVRLTARLTLEGK